MYTGTSFFYYYFKKLKYLKTKKNTYNGYGFSFLPPVVIFSDEPKGYFQILCSQLHFSRKQNI